MVAIDVRAGSFADTSPRAALPSTRPIALDLASRLHDTVVQRLAGLSLALGVEQPFDARERSRCREEVLAALDELRGCLEDAVAGDPTSRAGVDTELAALAREHPGVDIAWTCAPRLPSGPVEQLVLAVLAEGVRNARKHASPRTVRLEVAHDQGTIVVALHNDGVRARPQTGCGMGLRLLATEASLYGGLIDSRRAEEEGWWSLSLILPTSG